VRIAACFFLAVGFPPFGWARISGCDAVADEWQPDLADELRMTSVAKRRGHPRYPYTGRWIATK